MTTSDVVDHISFLMRDHDHDEEIQRYIKKRRYLIVENMRKRERERGVVVVRTDMV